MLGFLCGVGWEHSRWMFDYRPQRIRAMRARIRAFESLADCGGFELLQAFKKSPEQEHERTISSPFEASIESARYDTDLPGPSRPYRAIRLKKLFTGARIQAKYYRDFIAKTEGVAPEAAIVIAVGDRVFLEFV